MAYVAGMPVKAALIYVALHAAATAVASPGGVILTLTGGFLFGVWVGAGLTLVGATLGATGLFLIARTALGVPLRAFVVATLLGIIPGAFVFSSIGAGLGSIFDSMQEFTLKGALTPQALTALIGLAVLALIPVVVKRIKARKATSN